MNGEIEKEKEKIIAEWLQKAKDDLESAGVLFKETDNYEIVAYHAHQAIEKFFKAKLLKRRETFKFIHDLNSLLQQLYKGGIDQSLLEKISFVNSLYPRLRYPTGDAITKEQAGKCLEIAHEIFTAYR